LYNDGRVITGVVPTTDFNGNHLYQTNQEPNNDEIQKRVEQYFIPYHQKLEALLQQLKNQFGHVLLLDAHSIRKQVLGIQSSPFPDLILGNNDSLTSTLALDVSAQAILSGSDYSFSYNHPFKGVTLQEVLENQRKVLCSSIRNG
jgi:N-formylglutamate amidohydrolase